MVLAAALCWSMPAAKAASRDVEAILAAMTVAEKVAMMHGAEDPLTAQGSPDQRGAGYVPGVPRLGVPPLRLTDGPAGVRTARPATALPAPLALAATFDPQLALRFGTAVGREARAANQDVVLAPMVDIIRTPLTGRAFESLGEDPYLAARVAEAEVRGIQGAGAIATVKHLAANNQEDHRSAVDARVDERTLHEIYLPPFAAAVRAGAGAVMCGYYAVNGVPACQNPMLLDRDLRDELGFTGWVVSDWGATHATLPSLLAGLDMEMWSGARYGELVDLVPQYVPETLLDRAVRRILNTMDRAGLLQQGRARPTPDRAAHRALAREIAIGGTVLLRNSDRILPLTGEDLPSLVLIGPVARSPLTGGGGSSHVAAPDDTRSLWQALRARAGARVRPTRSASNGMASPYPPPRSSRPQIGPDHRPRRPGQFRMAMERRPEGAAVGPLRPGLAGRSGRRGPRSTMASRRERAPPLGWDRGRGPWRQLRR